MTKPLKRVRGGRLIEEGEVPDSGGEEEDGEMREEHGDYVTISMSKGAACFPFELRYQPWFSGHKKKQTTFQFRTFQTIQQLPKTIPVLMLLKLTSIKLMFHQVILFVAVVSRDKIWFTQWLQCNSRCQKNLNLCKFRLAAFISTGHST